MKITDAPYHEGSIFCVPLREGGFAIGVIARVSKNNSGGLLGYFFGPKLKSIPNSSIANSLKPSCVFKILRFGDLSLLRKEWPIVFRFSNWKRQDWPMPYFVRRDDISKKAWRVQYDDNDVCQVISEKPEPFDSPLERAAMYGSGAVELLLTKLLNV